MQRSAGPRDWRDATDGTERPQPDIRCKLRLLEAGFATLSRQDRLHHFAVDIRESHIAPGKANRQFFVVDAEQVEHGGVQIMNVNFVLDRFVAYSSVAP